MLFLKNIYVKLLQLCQTLCNPNYSLPHQAPLSIGFSMQEYSSELPCTSPADLPDIAIEPTSLRSPALVSGFFTTSTTKIAITRQYHKIFFKRLLVEGFI